MSMIEKIEEGKIIVEVPIEYTVFDNITLEFDSVEDMRQKLNDVDFVEDLPLGSDPTYIDGSYRVNFNYMEEELDMPVQVKEAGDWGGETND